jgi:hypothetical protein
MSFVSNGGKFKLYTVLNGLIFPAHTQPRISFERPISLRVEVSLFVPSPEIEDLNCVSVFNLWAQHKKSFYSIYSIPSCSVCLHLLILLENNLLKAKTR